MRRIWLAAFCFCILTQTGCAGRAISPETLGAQARANIRNGRTRVISRSGAYSREDSANTPKEFDTESGTAEGRAQKIANALADMAIIDNASVVITGNTAIIGIGPNGALDDAELLRTKNEVEKTAKYTDAEIDHVAVTATPDLVRRIRNMTGSATSGYSDAAVISPKMRDVIGQLTPHS